MEEASVRPLLSLRGLRENVAGELLELLLGALKRHKALSIRVCGRPDAQGGARLLLHSAAEVLDQPFTAPSPRGEDRPFFPYFPVAEG